MAGLGTASGTITAMFPKASSKIGANGLVSWSGDNYDTDGRISAWTLNLSAASKPATPLRAGGVLWDEAVPGLVSWSGTFEAMLDTADAPGLPTLAGVTPQNITLKLTEEGATDNQFTGPALLTQVSPSVTVGELATASYAFASAGDLTLAGTANVLPAGVLGIPDTGSLVLRAATDRTWSGDAFWTSIGITCTPGELIRVEVGWQGTGAWTEAWED
jgi:hypothetical protein